MALYNEISSYPTEIDNPIFYSDLDLKNKSDVDKYYTAMSQKKYDEAKTIMVSSNFHGTFASLYNLLENRIYNLQQYISTKEKPKKIFNGTTPAEPEIQYGVIQII